MRLVRYPVAVFVLLTLALAIRAEAAATLPNIPEIITKDLNRSFPNTAVGQTSTLQCLGLCFRLPTSPEGSCDGSGTITLDKALAAPFFASNFRKGPGSQCGGAPVTLPTSLSSGQAVWFDARFSPTQPGSFTDSLRLSGFNYFFSGSTGTASVCTPNATTLCVNGNRFAVTANWTTVDGQTGAGQAVSLTADTGYFWFFSASNVEMVLKVLDACSVNRSSWVFAGGLTNVKVDITVRDTVTGAVRTYHNPQGTAFQPIQDTSAFSSCSSSSNGPQRVGTPTGTALSVGHGRFRVTTSWQANGQSGSGQAVQLSDETGYFWFFSPNNVEMLVKVLDACSFNQSFWVFAGGLTNVKVDITVEDLATGARKTYSNPRNTAFAPIQDTQAFSCAGGDGLPPDPGAAGRQTLQGIDSDHDGVRDDLQRLIHLTYPGAASTITALEQAAKTVQSALVDAGSHGPAVDHATQMLRNFECLSAIRPGDSNAVSKRLLAAALNTEERGLAYLRYNDQLGGEAFPLKDPAEWRTSCDFPVSATADGQPLPELKRGKALCGVPKETTVFFVNGVFNDCEQAGESLAALTSAASASLPSTEYTDAEFVLACNKTFSYVVDLWVAVKQRLENDFERFYRYLSNVEPMPDFMQEAYAQIAAGVNVDALITSPTTLNHIALYKRKILEGRKVVLVAHSQGNLYANRAWDNVTSTEQRSLGIVSVGNPDTKVADGRPYTTLTNDIIIRPIPFALPANTSNGGFTFADVTGHQFVSSYLAAGSNSRTRILGHLRNAIETLESPTAGAGDGVITVTLNWGSQPDVDLHVFEPDGDPRLLWRSLRPLRIPGRRRCHRLRTGALLRRLLDAAARNLPGWRELLRRLRSRDGHHPDSSRPVVAAL